MTARDAHRLETEEENLAYWDTEAAPLQELCLLQARSAAEYAATLILSGELREPEAIATLCPTRDKGASATPRLLQIRERLAFCSTLLSAVPDIFTKAGEMQHTPIPEAPLQVATLDNPLFAMALDAFAEHLPNTAKELYPTFSAVMDALTSGAAAFGMLPVEDAREGRLLRLLEQLEGREIEILLTVDVAAADGNTVRFALLTHEALADTCRTLFANALDSDACEEILECAVLEEGGDTLLEALAAAAECGLSLRRTDARPAPYREDGFFSYPIFKASEKKTALFEAYLTLFLPRTVIAARYYHIKRRI